MSPPRNAFTLSKFLGITSILPPGADRPHRPPPCYATDYTLLFVDLSGVCYILYYMDLKNTNLYAKMSKYTGCNDFCGNDVKGRSKNKRLK